MRHWIRKRLPTEETLKAHPSLRWMGPLLRRPWLWQLNRRSVALGAGIINALKVGEHALLGAGATAVEDLPAYAVAFGLPARVTRFRDAAEEYL